MKHHLSISFCLILDVFFLFSCNKDIDESNLSTNLLSGSTWAFTVHYTYFNNEGDEDDDLSYVFYYTLGPGEVDEEIKSSGIVYCDAFYFKKDGSFTEVYKTDTYQGSYTLNGTTLILNYYGSKGTVTYDLISDSVRINGQNYKALVSKVSLSEEENHVTTNGSNYYREDPKAFVQVQPSWMFVTFN